MANLFTLFPEAMAYLETDVKVGRFVLNSQQVNQNDVFIALQGAEQDGRDFIQQAFDKGAIIVLAESGSRDDFLKIKFAGKPIIFINNLRDKISFIAGIYYNNPSYKLNLIGVTGTNGKTTTTHILAQWKNLVGGKAGVLGTNGDGFLDNLQPVFHTTGSAFEVQESLHNFVKHGADLVAMEASSHGIAQGRIDSLDFDVALFTNLSRDHLDYHLTMSDYEATKFKLLTKLRPRNVIINIDDETGLRFVKHLPSAIVVTTKLDVTKILKDHKFVQATKIDYQENGTKIEFESSWGNGVLNSPLIGDFNVVNILLALAGLLVLEVDLKALVATSSKLQNVAGRMQVFHKQNKPRVVVDFAHSPDALEKVLQTLKAICKGKLICVFGCGGERDRGKRPMMARISQIFSDKAIVTLDNPRSEDIKQIMDDITAGFTGDFVYQTITDRKEAIRQAIKQAGADDVVLVAGKGHEDYQFIGNEKIPFSDIAIVKEILELS